MHIEIKTIPHKDQEYETVGFYETDADGTQQILVSDLSNPDYEFLIALHELIEAKLCEKHGIPDQEITDFDVAFEQARPAGSIAEPGDDILSPYRDEHCFATGIERLMCVELGITWADYEGAVLAVLK